MMNNAKAELDARTARGPGTESSIPIAMTEFGQHRSNGTTPESDGGGSGYDEEFAEAQRQRGF